MKNAHLWVLWLLIIYFSEHRKLHVVNTYNITPLKLTKGIMCDKKDKQKEDWENASRKMCCVWALLHSLFSMYTSTCWKSIYTLYDLMLPLTEIICTELENLFYDSENHFLWAWSSRETLDLMQYKVPFNCHTQLSYDQSLQTSFFE